FSAAHLLLSLSCLLAHPPAPLARLSVPIYYSYAPRHLHSFPTRRSSDLETGKPVLQEHLKKMRCLTLNTLPMWRPLLSMKNYQTDRKSTRLNSSHVSISYAVFCLKKKNKADTERYQLLHNSHTPRNHDPA